MWKIQQLEGIESQQQAWLRSLMHQMLLKLIYMMREPVHGVERADEGKVLGVVHQEMTLTPEVCERRLMMRHCPLLPKVPTWQILQWQRCRLHLPLHRNLE